MYKSLGLVLALATLSANAQYPDPASQQSSSAPILQSYPGAPSGPYSRAATQSPQIFETQPAAGVYVRSDVPNGVQTITSSGPVTELRILQGRADITLHHPADHSEILVDLPNGQVSLLKDGLYTFNAQTNTIRTLHGEAEAVSKDSNAKGVKIKETQQLAFFPGARLKSVNSYPYELTADLLPYDGQDGHGDGGRSGYGEGFYGGGYPYGGYPYGFYPYGYGYPIGLGLGFGYGGGFYRGGYGGGFRGGYGGGFHGGGFHR
jgi:hypothetical protein